MRVRDSFILPEADMATGLDMAAGTGVVVEDGGGSTISWAAVVAGGVAAAAVSMVLLAFGIGVGFSVVSPWNEHGVSSTTFSIGTGIYLIVVSMLASTIGGYLAGRLRARWAGVHHDEVYFRDTAHGFLAWAFALLLGAVALGGATTHILAGASAGSIPAAAAAAGSSGAPGDIYVDRLLRNDAPPVAGAASPQVNATSANAELTRLLAPVTRKGGNISDADRAYAARIVVMRTGLGQPEAERRVSDVVADAKKATDDARKAAAKLSLWIAASMLAGALASILAATEGGLLRDSKWYEPGWRPGAYGTERSPR